MKIEKAFIYFFSFKEIAIGLLKYTLFEDQIYLLIYI